MGYYTRMLAGMLAYDEGDELMYCRATPRAWLDPGKEIRVERLQTRFGPTSFTLTAKEDGIHGVIELPTRYRPSQMKLRLRVNGRIEQVKLNGQTATFDSATETVVLPWETKRIEIEATVIRSVAISRGSGSRGARSQTVFTQRSP